MVEFNDSRYGGMVDALALGASATRRGGSSPSICMDIIYYVKHNRSDVKKHKTIDL